MNLFELYASLKLDDKEYKKGVKDSEKETMTLSKSIGTLGGSLDKNLNRGLAVAGGGLLAFAGYGVKTASDLQEVQNVVDTVFGDMSKDVDSWAKKAMESYGLSELQAKKFSGTLGALLDSSGITGDALIEMSTDLTGLAGDFASFYNLPHEEAFDKIKAGISGETEPLKALGINMSVANMEAFALTKGINKQWKEMTQAEQTTLRYQYIMEKGEKASGDFADTLNTSLANQLRVAGGEIQTMAGELGQKLLPIILDFIKWLRENTDTLLMLASAIVGAVVALKMMVIINTIVGFIKTWKTATEGMTIAQKLLNLALMLNPIGIVVGLIGLLVGAILYLWNTNENFKNAVLEIFAKIKEGIQKFVDAVNEFFTVTLPQALSDMVMWFVEKGRELKQWAIDLKDKLVAKLGELKDRVVQFFKEDIPNAIDKVVQWFKDLPNKIKEALSNLWETMKGIGKDILEGLWEGIIGAKDWLMGKIKGIGKWITDGFKNIFKIGSPSKVFEVEIGYNLARGLGIGFEDEMIDVNKEMEKAFNPIFESPSVAGVESPLNSLNGMMDKNNITINVYSPSALTPSEVARQTKKSLQDLAFQF